MRVAAILFPFVFIGSACSFGKAKVPEGAEQPWTQMSKSQRSEHMAKFVAPRMKEVFQKFDPERFADFSCATCHGDGAQADFAMPNPQLPQLNASNFYKKHRKESPEVVKFMWKEVESNFADAIGTTYGPKGSVECSSCHVVRDR